MREKTFFIFTETLFENWKNQKQTLIQVAIENVAN